ncbi:uncharacterized protein LOC126249112 [Schistocerca nitens]|uniref:uncharacterized protein LOC126249112 n=1 Tax=Schistocerca nitens TaxID=7011 RepID=UPI002118C240|nr:uncharacterized protein LOC126249112 [Schistocerca nitens]
MALYVDPSRSVANCILFSDTSFPKQLWQTSKHGGDIRRSIPKGKEIRQGEKELKGLRRRVARPRHPSGHPPSINRHGAVVQPRAGRPPVAGQANLAAPGRPAKILHTVRDVQLVQRIVIVTVKVILKTAALAVTMILAVMKVTLNAPAQTATVKTT